MVTGSSSSRPSAVGPAVRALSGRSTSRAEPNSGLALRPLLRVEPGGAEVVGPGQRADEGRQGGAVVGVAPRRASTRSSGSRQAVARARGSRSGARPVTCSMRVLGAGELGLELVARCRGAATARGGTSGCRPRGRPRRAARSASWLRSSAASCPTMKKVMRRPALGEELEQPRHDGVEVGRERLPAGVAVGLQVGPQVVEVEREAGDRRPARGAHRGASPRISGSSRSASASVSSTFSVAFDQVRRADEVQPRHAGGASAACRRSSRGSARQDVAHPGDPKRAHVASVSVRVHPLQVGQEPAGSRRRRASSNGSSGATYFGR